MLLIIILTTILSSSIGASDAACTNGTNPCLNGGSCVANANNSTLYTCNCPDMYYGDNCETESPCKSIPCLGVSTCSRNGDVAVCSCESGRIGDRCQTFENPCDFRWKSCKNFGLCTVDSNDAKGFTCRCTNPLWTGPICDAPDRCSPLASVKYCKNGGACTQNMDGTVDCACTGAFHNTTCQHENKCFAKPCQGNSSTCTKLMHDYTCQCEAGLIGRNCEHSAADPCNTAGAYCLNGAVCVNDAQQKYGYKCNCPADKKWIGEHCEVRDYCLGNACTNSATCKNEPNAGAGMNYTCTCTVGFHGTTCQYEDKCAGKPCQGVDSVCVRDMNDYTCNCEAERNGTNCEISLKDFCIGNKCENSAACENKASTGLSYTCNCPNGFTGSLCEDVVTTPAPVVTTMKSVVTTKAAVNTPEVGAVSADDDTPAIAGGVAAAVVIILILVLVLFIYLRRRKSRKQREQVKFTGFSAQGEEGGIVDFPAAETNGVVGVQQDQPKKFYDSIPDTLPQVGSTFEPLPNQPGIQNNQFIADGDQIYMQEAEGGQVAQGYSNPTYASHDI